MPSVFVAVLLSDPAIRARDIERIEVPDVSPDEPKAPVPARPRAAPQAARQRGLFEAPVELIGQRVEILYHEHCPEQVEIRSAGLSYGLLRQIDLHVNARVKRDKNGQVELTGAAVTQSGRLWEA